MSAVNPVTLVQRAEAIGVSGVFMLYGALASLAAIFFFFILPETRGKTLQEIDAELRCNRCSLDCFISKIIFKKRPNSD